MMLSKFQKKEDFPSRTESDGFKVDHSRGVLNEKVEKVIIILVSQYFTKRDEFRYGIETFREQGYKTYVWDISRILQPGSVEYITKNSGEHSADYIKRFDSTLSVVKAINTAEQDFCFITMVGYDRDTRRIFRAISRNGYKYICTGPYSVGVFPRFENERRVNHLGRFWFLSKSFLRSLVWRIFNLDLRIPPKYIGIKPAWAFALAGGSESNAVGPLIGESTRIVRIHAADYDFYLRTRNRDDSSTPQNYIVYLDQAIAAAADAYARGWQLDIDPDKYYSDLTRFFDKVEEHYNMPVIIAAHPKANYDELGYSFGSHKIRSGFNSADTVAGASLVLLHYSTAINLAVVFNKPILFLTSDVLEKYKKPFIDGLSSFFEMKALNVNDPNIELPPIRIDTERYRQYFDRFIKAPETPETPFWESVISLIETH